MKNIKENIYLHDLIKLKQQHKILLQELNETPASSLPAPFTAKASKGVGKPPSDSPEKIDASDAILIGDRSNFHTPPFPLTFEVFKKNVHNCLIDSGASSNIMPYYVYLKLNIYP